MTIRVRKTGLFPMVADILHAGHILALSKAKQHCETLIVALNCNPDNKTPIQSVYERYIQLLGCRYVDAVIPYSGEKDLETLIKTTEYNVRFIGDDHSNAWTGKDWEEKNGIEIVVIPRDHGLSSSELKNRIRTKEKPDTV